MNEETPRDPAAERALQAGLYRHGWDAFIEVDGLITEENFSDPFHRMFHRCLWHIFQQPGVKPDPAMVDAAAKATGCSDAFYTPDNIKLLRGIMQFPVERSNVRLLAEQVRKLHIARTIRRRLLEAASAYENFTGAESLQDIVGVGERAVFDFEQELAGETEDAALYGAEAPEFVRYLADNPVEQVGYSSGMPEYDKAIGGGLRPGGIDMIVTRTKTGKALPLNATVHTPAGPRKIGDLKVGDEVCDAYGGVGKVTGVFPQGVRPMYRMVFRNGDYIDCDRDHLWRVSNSRFRHIVEVKTTGELLGDLVAGNGRPKWGIQLPKPLNFSAVPVPIDPYSLGLLLGDGCLSGPAPLFTSCDQELVAAISDGFRGKARVVARADGKSFELQSPEYRGRPVVYPLIESLGLRGKKSATKFVPDVYKYNSAEVRLAVLQGLMDTDGTADTRGTVEYATISRRLLSDVKWLAQSLGFVCTQTARLTTCNGKEFASYRLLISGDDTSVLFRLERKRQRCHKRTKQPLLRNIIRIVERPPAEAVCIAVDSPDQLYVTDHAVVTHNSMIADTTAVALGRQGVRTLIVDTEMSRNDRLPRIIAMLSGVKINDIETGRYRSPQDRARAEAAAAELKSLPIDYKSVVGMGIPEIIAVMRRWVMKTVGLDPKTRKAKPSAVLFDYIKLTDQKQLAELREYQAIGFLMTELHAFMVRYGVACRGFTQLNREGDVSQSERIKWLSTSYSRFRWKDEEDLALEFAKPKDQPRYTHIMDVALEGQCRYGPGLAPGDYLHFESDLSRAFVKEGPLNSKLGDDDPSKKEVERDNKTDAGPAAIAFE